jgi:hypothetical protein
MVVSALCPKGHYPHEATVVDDGQVPDPVAPNRDRGLPDAERAFNAERQIHGNLSHPISASSCFPRHDDHPGQQAVETEEQFIASASEGVIRAGE